MGPNSREWVSVIFLVMASLAETGSWGTVQTGAQVVAFKLLSPALLVGAFHWPAQRPFCWTGQRWEDRSGRGGHKQSVHQARHYSAVMCVSMGFWLGLEEGRSKHIFFFSHVVQGCLGKAHSTNTCHLDVPKVYEGTANPRGWSIRGTWHRRPNCYP